MSQQNKGFAYGLSAQVAQKIEGKRDVGRENEVKEWIEAITGEKFDPELSYQDNLKSGIRLCNLMNTIKPKSCSKVSDSPKPFKQMENLTKFLNAIEKYGVEKLDLFQTVDLCQGTNLPAVTATIFSFGRICQTKPEWDPSSSEYKNFPILGPKQSAENVRDFDEETLAEGRKVIGIQAGTNKLASQSGQNFGGRRNIN